MNQSTDQAAVNMDDGTEFLDVLTLLVSHWRLLFFVPTLAALLMFGGSFLMKPTFTANASFMPPTQNSPASALLSSLSSSLGGLGGALSGSLGVKSETDQWIAILQSRNIADQLIQKYDLKTVYGVELMKDAREMLAAKTDIRSDKSGLIMLSVDDDDPRRSAAIANDYVVMLRVLAQSQVVSEATARRSFYETQLAKAKVRLEEAQNRLKGAGIAADTLKMNPDVAVAQVAQLKAQVAAQEIEMGVLARTMTPSNADYQRSAATLSELRSQLARLERAGDGGEKSEQGRYVDLFRDFKYAETIFELMAKQYEMAKVDELGGSSTVTVIDSALPPEKQSKPRRLLLAGLVGLSSFFMLGVWLLLRNAVVLRSRDPVFAARLSALRSAWRYR